jgi:16S rRNA (guanine1516-N2)-methyltransferase
MSMNNLQLTKTPAGLVLTDRTLELRGDFTRLLPRLKQGVLQRELLVRAAKIKNAEHPIALDATAGLGEDSLLLAAAGFQVVLFERDKTIAALLADTIARAMDVPELQPAVSRMELRVEDSVNGMQNLDFRPDVVLLDPMFPEKRHNALTKKKLQLFQQLESPCENETELLEAARATGAAKIVIKRPLKGPYLAGVKPSHSVCGKTVRYDCIVCS